MTIKNKKNKDPIAVAFGRYGGLAKYAKHGKEAMQAMAKKRWEIAKLKKLDVEGAKLTDSI